MDLSLRHEAELSEATHEDIRRIVKLWSELRGKYGAGGPFLLGGWSIADAFFTPVAAHRMFAAVARPSPDSRDTSAGVPLLGVTGSEGACIPSHSDSRPSGPTLCASLSISYQSTRNLYSQPSPPGGQRIRA